jgi:hypothetical protein
MRLPVPPLTPHPAKTLILWYAAKTRADALLRLTKQREIHMTSNNQEPTQHQESTEIEAVDRKELEHQISEAEQNERKKAVAFAYASIGLSGFETSDEMRHLGQRYIIGEIDLNEFVMLSQRMLPDTNDSLR